MSTQTTYRFEPGASRGWLQHFELSWRALRRAPSFAVPAVVTIALGIGAATAVFSLVYAILLRPFPYPDADRLVRVFTVAEGEQGAERNCSLLDIEDYNRRSSLLENIGGYTVFNSQIEGDGFGEAVVIAQLNQEAMHAVGVQPVLGRLFTEEEDRRGGPVNKALLSHGLWQGRFGGAPDALGKMIRLPMGDFEVVGVMPAGFGYPDRATLWLTMEAWYALGLESYREKQRDQRWYATVARLAPGASVEQAQDEMGEVARQLAAEFPATNRDVGVRLVPLRDAEVGEVRPYLMLLTAGRAAGPADLHLQRGQPAGGTGPHAPIGQMVQWGDTVGPSNPYCRVVGVVGDVRHDGAERDAIELYYPFTQWPVGGGYYVLRTRLDQAAVSGAIRAAVTQEDRNAAVVSIRSMTERIDAALWQRRLWGVLFSAFAALALSLAGVGLYGLLSYSVSVRARDIGIRLALGATPAGVRAMVVRRGMALVLLGLAIGLVLSVGALRTIAHLLVDVAVLDWAIYAPVAGCLTAAGLLASLWPAVRASRLDPAQSLRSE